MNGKELGRQEIISAIDAGKFKKVDNSKAIMKVFFAFIIFATVMTALTTIIPAIIRGEFMSLLALFVTLPMQLFPLLAVYLVMLLVRGTKVADLSKIDDWQRQVILNGDKIEANLDSIDEDRNTFILRASANYNGTVMGFVSPKIGIRPIPFDERKITVYINPQNPSQYVLDIYSHLPMQTSDFVLHDRSELHCEPNSHNKRTDATTVVITTIVVVFVMMMIMGMMGMMVMGVSGGGGFMIIPILMMAAIVGSAIYFGTKSAKKQQSIMQAGYYVEATGERYWVTKSKNSTTRHLSARYVEPGTNRVHEFHTTGSSEMQKLVKGRVKVFLNPENTKEYYIDIEASLRDRGFTTNRES